MEEKIIGHTHPHNLSVVKASDIVGFTCARVNTHTHTYIYIYWVVENLNTTFDIQDIEIKEITIRWKLLCTLFFFYAIMYSFKCNDSFLIKKKESWPISAI